MKKTKLLNCEVKTVWVCPECGKVVYWTMKNVADCGTPYCPNDKPDKNGNSCVDADVDMKLDTKY